MSMTSPCFVRGPRKNAHRIVRQMKARCSGSIDHNTDCVGSFAQRAQLRIKRRAEVKRRLVVGEMSIAWTQEQSAA